MVDYKIKVTGGEIGSKHFTHNAINIIGEWKEMMKKMQSTHDVVKEEKIINPLRATPVSLTHHISTSKCMIVLVFCHLLNIVSSFREKRNGGKQYVQ